MMAGKRVRMTKFILVSMDGDVNYVNPRVARRFYGLEENSILLSNVYFLPRIPGFALDVAIALAQDLEDRNEPIGLRRFCQEEDDERFEAIMQAVWYLKVGGYVVEERPDPHDRTKISSDADNETRASLVSVLPVKPAVKPKNTQHSLDSVEKRICRNISGRREWMRFPNVEPAGNEFSSIGVEDRVIKIWDQSTGKLKVSLTGHIGSVRGVAFSPRHPYLFSCGEDTQVKCWDLEYSKVIRHYQGHLSEVFSMALHPTIDVLVTGGRDGRARVWDMRSKANVHTLTGHTNTVATVVCRVYDPRVITGSHDSTIKLWDLVAGKSALTIANQHESIEELTLHPTLNAFSSVTPDNFKQWKSVNGKFIKIMNSHNAIMNCLAVNEEGVLVSGGDNDGSMYCKDWGTGYNFQRLQLPVKRGSMDSEAGIFSVDFDLSGTRMITTAADNIIEMF